MFDLMFSPPLTPGMCIVVSASPHSLSISLAVSPS
jgi:hypothetical protein